MQVFVCWCFVIVLFLLLSLYFCWFIVVLLCCDIEKGKGVDLFSYLIRVLKTHTFTYCLHQGRWPGDSCLQVPVWSFSGWNPQMPSWSTVPPGQNGNNIYKQVYHQFAYQRSYTYVFASPAPFCKSMIPLHISCDLIGSKMDRLHIIIITRVTNQP